MTTPLLVDASSAAVPGEYFAPASVTTVELTEPLLYATRPRELTRDRLAGFIGAGFAGVWRRYLYLTIQFLVCSFALSYFLLVPSLAAALLITIAGLFAVGGLVIGARGWAAMYRRFDRTFLQSVIMPPPEFIRPRGFWRSLGAMLFDGTGWRALLYMFITFPLALISWTLSTVFLATGLAGLLWPLWWRFLPPQEMADGSLAWGVIFEDYDQYWAANTPGRITLVMIAGLALLIAWVYLTYGLTRVFEALGRALLGATPGSLRVAQLRRQRAAVVADSDTRLRQIERDLHDGTQAQLTAIAMQIGEARESLAAGEDPALASSLLANAHGVTKDAMVGLRGIVLGMRPPVLDAGLPVALQTLITQTAMPTTLDFGADADWARFMSHRFEPTNSDDGLEPAIRSIAYYTVAELLTNAAKYSGATQVNITAERLEGGTLLITVRDNGAGGARIVPPAERTAPAHQTGLQGIADRLAAVDGTILINSPVGGPTEIVVTMPMSIR